MSDQAWVLVIAAPLAALLSIMVKRRLAAQGQTTTFRYLLVENARDLLIPFAIVALAYAALAFVVARRDTDAATIGAIRRLEDGIRFLYQTTRKLKLGSLATLGVLVGFTLIGFSARYRRWSEGISKGVATGYRAFDRYQKTARTAMVVATALASFSFFSARTEVFARRLELRAKAADADYRELVAGVAAAIERDVSTELAALAQMHAPGTYQATQSSWKAGVDLKRKLVLEYPPLSTRYRFTHPPAETAVADFKKGVARVEELAGEIAARQAFSDHASSESVGAPVASEIPAKAPPDATTTELDRLKRTFAAVEERPLPEVLRVFDDAAGKKIIPAVLGVLADPKRVSLIGRLVAEVPMFEPFLDVLKGAVVKYTGERATTRAREMVDDAISRKTEVTAKKTQDAALAIAETYERDIPGGWEKVPQSVMERVAAAEAAERSRQESLKTNVDAEAKRARPAAEAAIRRENAELATKLRGKWPSTPADPLDLSAYYRRLAELSTSRSSKWKSSRPAPTPSGADQFIADAQGLKDPWRENEALKAAVGAVESGGTNHQDFVGLAKVTEQHLPGSAAGRSVARAVEATRPAPPVESHAWGGVGSRSVGGGSYYRSSSSGSYRTTTTRTRVFRR